MMKISCLLLIGWFSVAVAAGSAAMNEAIAELLRVDQSRLAGLVDRDMRALRRLMADDLVYVHASGRVQGKQEYLGLLEAGDLQYLSLKYEEPPRVRLYDGSTGIVTARLRVDAKTMTGTPNQRVIVTTAIYIRTNREWRLVSQHNTSLP